MSAETMELTGEATRALQIVAGGGKIEARRTFPFPHHYVLIKADGFRYATELTRETVATLATAKLITPTIIDRKFFDAIDYTASEDGKAVALSGGRL